MGTTAIAILLGLFGGRSLGLLEFRAGDDLVVYTGNDLFDHAAFSAGNGLLGGSRCFRRRLWRGFLLLLLLWCSHLGSFQLRLRRRILRRWIFLRRWILRAQRQREKQTGQ